MRALILILLFLGTILPPVSAQKEQIKLEDLEELDLQWQGNIDQGLSNPHDIVVDNGIIYIADGEGGLRIIRERDMVELYQFSLYNFSNIKSLDNPIPGRNVGRRSLGQIYPGIPTIDKIEKLGDIIAAYSIPYFGSQKYLNFLINVKDTSAPEIILINNSTSIKTFSGNGEIYCMVDPSNQTFNGLFTIDPNLIKIADLPQQSKKRCKLTNDRLIQYEHIPDNIFSQPDNTITIYDISSPTNPIELGNLTTDSSYLLENNDDTLILKDSATIELYDFSDPINITMKGIIDNPWEVNEIQLKDDTVYIMQTRNNIINAYNISLSNDISTTIPIQSSYNLSNSPSFYYFSDYLYTDDGDFIKKSILQYDPEDLSTIRNTLSWPTTRINNVLMNDDYILTYSRYNPIKFYSINNQSIFVEDISLEINWNYYFTQQSIRDFGEIIVEDDLLYVSDDEKFTIYDIGDIQNIKQIYQSFISIKQMSVNNGIIHGFIEDKFYALKLVNNDLYQIWEMPEDQSMYYLEFSSGYLEQVAYYDGIIAIVDSIGVDSFIRLYDYNDHSLIYSIPIDEFTPEIEIFDNYLLVSHINKLKIYDLIDPSNPLLVDQLEISTYMGDNFEDQFRIHIADNSFFIEFNTDNYFNQTLIQFSIDNQGKLVPMSKISEFPRYGWIFINNNKLIINYYSFASVFEFSRYKPGFFDQFDLSATKILNYMLVVIILITTMLLLRRYFRNK